MSDEGFISRWSRRKSQARTETLKDDVQVPQPAPEAGPARPPDKTDRGQADPDAVPAQPAPAVGKPGAGTLPPVESLTPDSDFTAFMKPEVDADTKRKAVKMLFQDPRYNLMDGLDVYIDDYSKPDPLPEGWLEKMTQVARLGEYHDPDREKVEPDKENAEKTARENYRRLAEPSENGEIEQPVADSEGGAAADTSNVASQSAEVKELPPQR
jgi:hypothetical protein